MVSGTCSPSRKWFTLQAADESLQKDIEVRQWLKAVEDACYVAFSKAMFIELCIIFTCKKALLALVRR